MNYRFSLLIDIEMLMLCFSRIVATPEEILQPQTSMARVKTSMLQPFISSDSYSVKTHTEMRTEIVGLGLEKIISSVIHFAVVVIVFAFSDLAFFCTSDNHF